MIRPILFSVFAAFAATYASAAETSVVLQEGAGGNAPRLALTRTGSVFVWTSLESDSQSVLVAAFVDRPDPVPRANRIVLSRAQSPYAIASDGDGALVVWLEGNWLRYAVLAPPNRIVTSGTLSAFAELAVGVTWGGSAYIVAWTDLAHDVLTTTVDGQGRIGPLNVVSRGGLPVPNAIAIASSTERTLVAWGVYVYDATCNCASASDVDAALLKPDGNLLAPPHVVATDAESPSVAAHDDEFLIAFSSRNSVRAAFIGGDHDGDVITIDESGSDPRVATANGGFVVVWTAQSYGDYVRLTSARVTADGIARPGSFEELGSRRFKPYVDVAGRPNGALVVVIDNVVPWTVQYSLVVYEDPARARAVRRW